MSSTIGPHFQELYRYRGLVSSLVLRELKARYRGSVLGFLWTFLNPLMLLAVYALVFSVYFRIQMEHYAGFMFTGLLPWIWFSSSLLEGTTAIASGGSLITKVLFPGQILPLVKVGANLLNYLLSLPVLLIFLTAMGLSPGSALVWLPLVVAVHLIFIAGLSLALATLNVFLRDIQHILSNLVTLWFFLTPILYPLAQVPQAFRRWVLLNPATLITLSYQDIFFYRRSPDLLYLGTFFILALVVLGLGITLFEHYKETLAEKI
ncbi:MAG: ABC transporter permease [Deltaproteobacteria bacterium]|nr:ABC transporter permease [Deltaproteobacteria bacterium]